MTRYNDHAFVLRRRPRTIASQEETINIDDSQLWGIEGRKKGETKRSQEKSINRLLHTWSDLTLKLLASHLVLQPDTQQISLSYFQDGHTSLSGTTTIRSPLHPRLSAHRNSLGFHNPFHSSRGTNSLSTGSSNPRFAIRQKQLVEIESVRSVLRRCWSAEKPEIRDSAGHQSDGISLVLLADWKSWWGNCFDIFYPPTIYILFRGVFVSCAYVTYQWRRQEANWWGWREWRIADSQGWKGDWNSSGTYAYWRILIC